MTASGATGAFLPGVQKSGEEMLLVFTRYPEPGRVKTRLIKTLGSEGAADLQRRMTMLVLRQAEELRQRRALTVAVCYAGGTAARMRDWLGEGFRLRRQTGAGLGERLETAFAEAFQEGYRRVVVVGADCPDLTAMIIAAALDALREDDLVIGPALDGGYYLLGMSRFEPRLLREISWGTDAVCAQTTAKARALKLKTVLLGGLADIDRPEDLRHFDYPAGA